MDFIEHRELIIGQYSSGSKLDIINRMNSFFTGTGDDGYTSLLGSGRVAKFDPQPQAYGAMDEASSALGLAKSFSKSKRSVELAQDIQRDLYHLMAEVAATAENRLKFQQIDQERIDWLEEQIEILADNVEVPKEFVIPGDSTAGAAFDLARTIIRRAERAVAELYIKHDFAIPHIVHYLNRLSSLCFVLALWENKQAGVEHPSLAKEK